MLVSHWKEKKARRAENKRQKVQPKGYRMKKKLQKKTETRGSEGGNAAQMID